MIRIGCHLSPSKGFMRMGQDALSIRANTFQFFLRHDGSGDHARYFDLLFRSDYRQHFYSGQSAPRACSGTAHPGDRRTSVR